MSRAGTRPRTQGHGRRTCAARPPPWPSSRPPFAGWPSCKQRRQPATSAGARCVSAASMARPPVRANTHRRASLGFRSRLTSANLRVFLARPCGAQPRRYERRPSWPVSRQFSRTSSRQALKAALLLLAQDRPYLAQPWSDSATSFCFTSAVRLPASFSVARRRSARHPTSARAPTRARPPRRRRRDPAPSR